MKIFKEKLQVKCSHLKICLKWVLGSGESLQDFLFLKPEMCVLKE